MRAHGPASPGAGDQLVQALGDVITVARVPWKQRISAFATEELKIAVSTHAATPEKILDDESRNRSRSADRLRVSRSGRLPFYASLWGQHGPCLFPLMRNVLLGAGGLWKTKFSINATGLTTGITIGKICTNGLCDKVPVPNRDKVPVESATKCPWITY